MTGAEQLQDVKNDSTHESVFRPVVLLMSGRMLSFVATFFIPVILTRIFAPAEFGTYKQLFLIQ